MLPKEAVDKQQQCWECLRRNLTCDGCRPVCQCCRSAGIVCPGYENRRPLTWVTPGNVTARIRRAKTATGTASAPAIASKKHRSQTRPLLLSPPTEESLTQPGAEAPYAGVPISTANNTCTRDADNPYVIILGDDNERDEGDDERESTSSNELSFTRGIITPQTKATSLALVSQKRRCSRSTQQQSISSIPISLESDEFELIEAVDYYNQQILPVITSNQLIPDAYSKRFNKNSLFRLMLSHRHSLISITIGFRILAVAQIHRLSINPRNAGPASDLWAAFFRHIGLALAALSNEIRRSPAKYLDNILRGIHLIAGSELFLLNSPHWRAHVRGFISIFQQHGGLATFVQMPGNSKYLVFSFLRSCIVANTTSSLHNQVIEVTCLDPLELYPLYKASIYAQFSCPPDLFLDILYINRLRLRLPTTSVIYSSPSAQVNVCEIMKHVHEFSAFDWIETSNLLNPDEVLVRSNLYQAAVALYAVLALPCTSKSHLRESCQDLMQTYRVQLFNALRAAIGSPVRIHTIYWPVVVAGVVASSGTIEERTLVEEHLNIGVNDNYSSSESLKALAILRRAWASGKTEWDDCFSEPNVIIV